MAVPKKKVSKARRDSRKSNWNKKILKKFVIAVSFSRSAVKKNFGNFFVE